MESENRANFVDGTFPGGQVESSPDGYVCPVSKTPDPPSILDVVDPEILRSLMQGFFYNQSTGLIMLYEEDRTGVSQVPIFDVSESPASSSPRLERLLPFAENTERNLRFTLSSSDTGTTSFTPSRYA